MSDDNKQDFKKNFSSSFVWLLMAAFLLALMVQNLIDTKFAKVSFSYQLEHLVNLQLLQPEDSRKIALNDNLATFSGKFRDRMTEEGKNRYKFLDLLNTNQTLLSDKSQSEKDLATLASKVKSSAEAFLSLSGIEMPKNGYVVIDEQAAGGNGNQRIVIKDFSKSEENLSNLESKFTSIKANPTAESLDRFGQDFSSLVASFRSPVLGIGNEVLKTTLRNIESQVTKINELPKTALGPVLAAYGASLTEMKDVVNNLNKEENGVRLGKLRSVRDYKEALDGYNQISTKLEENQVQLDRSRQTVANVVWFFNNQELSTRALEKEDSEKFHQWFINAKEEFENFAQNKGGMFKAPDQPLNKVLEKTFKSEEPSPNYFSYLLTFLPVLLLLGVLYMIFARQMKGVGGGAMSFGKSPAKLSVPGANKVTFKDVAGADEAIEELQEIVEFLKNPQKFTTLGGRIPKGVLCIGPPGTGKTLIAKAVAGEADRPFFSISGSDFVEMFVGVGASRIRDMFDTAKKNAPCIIFMDEIDAVGRHRGAGVGGGHDEREQTLNQLLVEMDGFDTNEGVILMAATNRPDVLDKALLRPGRFDRRVMVGLPDIKGRFDILKVHARKIKLDPSVDLMAIARGTPGSSGADLANLLNEAALLAARRGRMAVTAQEVAEARDKVLYGKERRSMEIGDAEKRTTAYHEAGHTIVSMFVEHADPIDKVTIIPRGMSLGATMFLPTKNRVSYWKKELIDQLAVLMGGRVAEEIFVSDISSGARQDIEQATAIARSMVCEWGMSDKLGAVSYDEGSSGASYGMHHEKKYSELTAREIDAEVREIVTSAHDRALQIVKDKEKEVQLVTDMLMEFETLDFKDIEDIVKGDWDIEEKKVRLKKANDLFKKPSNPLPMLPDDGLKLNPAQ